MSRHKLAQKQQRDTRNEAAKIVRSLNLSGENKHQSQMITQGVQRGIEMFIRQQNERIRELDKKDKKLKRNHLAHNETVSDQSTVDSMNKRRLPWVLLAITWLGVTGAMLFNLFF